ncbi:MAG: hypothetical protein ACMG6E_04020, partial [Candidatus Roizmanbacteria bacterium]
MYDNLSPIYTKVTPFSKLLAMVLFVTLPFIGFFFGVQYGKLQPHKIEYVTREKLVKVQKEEDFRDLLRRCGDIPDKVSLYGNKEADHFTQRSQAL